MTKKSLLVLIILLSNTCLWAQNYAPDSIMYSISYEYIKNDTIGKRYNIVPSTVTAPTYYFEQSAEAIKNSNNTEVKILTEDDYNYLPPQITQKKEEVAHILKLQKYDEVNWQEDRQVMAYKFPPSYIDSENSLILNFSPISHKEFFAVLGNNNITETYVFFFIFDDNRCIKKVYFNIISSGPLVLPPSKPIINWPKRAL